MKAIIKMFSIQVLRIVIRTLYIFPIKKNRVIFNAYQGSQYSCNPKYISEYLNSCTGDALEIIWAFNHVDDFRYLEAQGIKLVKYNSLKRFYYEATCKVSINNIGSYSWLPKRCAQEHVNTWHGGFGGKKCGLSESENNRLMKKTIQMSTNETSVLTSSSRQFDETIAIKDLGFHKQTMKIGYPRNDILFKVREGVISVRERICSKLGFSNESYILLYAPTWRYDTKRDVFDIDYIKVKKTLEEKYKKNVVVLARMHHLMSMPCIACSEIIDVTDYTDMQELLAIADCLITDYSTSAWDYAIMRKPIYLYATDVVAYTKKRGFHEDLFKWGFPVCLTNDELCKAISETTTEKAAEDANLFHKENGSYENGTACEKLCVWILEKCEVERKVVEDL